MVVTHTGAGTGEQTASLYYLATNSIIFVKVVGVNDMAGDSYLNIHSNFDHCLLVKFGPPRSFSKHLLKERSLPRLTLFTQT